MVERRNFKTIRARSRAVSMYVCAGARNVILPRSGSQVEVGCTGLHLDVPALLTGSEGGGLETDAISCRALPSTVLEKSLKRVVCTLSFFCSIENSA